MSVYVGIPHFCSATEYFTNGRQHTEQLKKGGDQAAALGDGANGLERQHFENEFDRFEAGSRRVGRFTRVLLASEATMAKALE